jgi:hypothetical protein
MGKKFFEAILADEDRFNRFFNLACTLEKLRIRTK